MQVPKPTADDIERFRSVVPDAPGVEIRPMFGNLGGFVNGNMFIGLLGADIGLKLAPKDAERLRAIDGGGPFGPPDRPMGGWVTMPPSLVGTPDAADWVDLARTFIAALPPKPPKRSSKRP